MTSSALVTSTATDPAADRIAEVSRNTAETRITVRINLDGTGQAKLHTGIGFFDSRARLTPPLRQQRDRDALSAALLDGTIDALVSDHTPVDEDAKTLPFAEAEPGATGLELLLSLALKWSQDSGVPLQRALAVVTAEPARVLGNALGTLQASVGQIVEGGVGDLCIFDPQTAWTVQDDALASQGKHTPFSGYELPGRVRMTLVGGQVAFDRS